MCVPVATEAFCVSGISTDPWAYHSVAALTEVR